MLPVLAVVILLGAALSAYWVWSLQLAGEDLTKSLATQSLELERLKVASAKNKAAGGQAGQSSLLTQELQGLRTELLQREKLAQDWQRGLLRPGSGHAARLQLVAQSIPAKVWVTQVTADDTQLEISGFTLEPAQLNEWVAKLVASPLLEGQKLSAAKLEHVTTALPKSMGVVTRPVWSFSLVSAMPRPPTVTGGKP